MERNNIQKASSLDSLTDEETNTTAIYALFTDGTLQYVATIPDEEVETALPSLTRRAIFKDVCRWELVGPRKTGE
jgi:hypothetical protein